MQRRIRPSWRKSLKKGNQTSERVSSPVQRILNDLWRQIGCSLVCEESSLATWRFVIIVQLTYVWIFQFALWHEKFCNTGGGTQLNHPPPPFYIFNNAARVQVCQKKGQKRQRNQKLLKKFQHRTPLKPEQSCCSGLKDVFSLRKTCTRDKLTMKMS